MHKRYNMQLNYEQKIKLLLTITGTKKSAIADAFGVTLPTINSRVKNGKFTLNERRKIAEVTGTEFVSKMVFSDGAEFSGETVRDMLDGAVAHVGITLTDLYNKSSKKANCDAFIKRTRTGKYTEEELAEIAELIGCTYVTHYVKDGSIII